MDTDKNQHETPKQQTPGETDMRTEFSERLERAAGGGMESLQREAVRCAMEAVARELREPAALRRMRFENAVLLDVSPNPDLIEPAAMCAN